MALIRVGLIRCDTHGLWFGPLMADHDPLLFQRPRLPVKQGQYSWMRGGLHQFFYTNYHDVLNMTVPSVEGFEITRVWDEHREAAELAATVFLGKPQVCETFAEVSDDVDLVFVADCNNDGSDHLELATPGLEKGVPTYVDKPFADSIASAAAILELSSKHNAPVYSQSICRVEPAFVRFRNRLPEVGVANFATLHGYGTAPAGLVHTVSITQLLFGPGIKTVQVLEAERHCAVYLDYGDRPDRPRHGVMINCDVGDRPFTGMTITVIGTVSQIHTTVLGDYVYAHGTCEIIKTIRDMVSSRETPASMGEVLETIAVIEAFKKARETGAAVAVEDASHLQQYTQ